MKKVFSSHSELCHIWAQQTQEDGRGANMFFEGTRIYSYGHHFCIANFVDSETVLFTTRDYSTTTAGHKSMTRQAVSHKTVFEVPSIGADEGAAIDHAGNIQYYHDEVLNEHGAAIRAHRHGQRHLHNAEAMAAKANEYIENFGIDMDPIAIDQIFTDEERAKLASKAAGYTEREKKRAAITLSKLVADLELWTGGDQTRGRSFWALPVKLRVRLPFDEKRAIVETSHGARVTCLEAAKFLKAMDAGADVDGLEIGAYKAQGVEDDILIIGCHKIPLDEVNRIRPAIADEVKYAKI